MQHPVRSDYDATRDFTAKGFRSGCYAPFVSLYFNPLGEVNACCRNQTYSLGNVARDRLDDIWNGRAIDAMRDALADYRFGAGCEFCEWMIAARDYKGAITHLFEEFAVAERRPPWPQGMEFAISNTCNFACVQCCGDWSSRIRSRREGLPPLAKVYPDQFFADLRRYLPHLKQAKFYGGEPFLARENFRIWDMMIEDGLRPSCHALTNGSQWNDGIERVLDRLAFSIGVSIDGVTRKTFEAIRVDGDFELVMANMARFREYTRRIGTQMMVSFSLMPQNWFELGDMLLHCEEMGYAINVIRVIDPPRFSLFSLPTAELHPIIAALEAQATTLLPRLARHRDVFVGVLASLRENAQERQREGYRHVKAVNVHLRRDHVAEATDLMKEGRWHEALAAAAQTPREHKNRFHALLISAHAMRRVGDLVGAGKAIEEAMGLTRRKPAIFVERAWLRLEQGRHADALADARHARSLLQPGQDDVECRVLHVLGLLLADVGETRDARECVRRLLELAPREPWASQEASRILFRCGLPAEAVEHADGAVALAGELGAERLVSALLDAARLRRSLKEFAACARDLERALAMQVDRADLHVECAWLLFEQGEVQRGHAAAARAHALETADGAVASLATSHVLGILCVETGRHREAVEHLERYFAGRPVRDPWTSQRLEVARRMLAEM